MIEDRWGGIGALGCGTPGDSLTFYLPEPLCRVRRAAGGAVRGAIHALYRDTAPCPPLAAPLPLPGSPGFGVRPACPAPRRLTAASLLAGRSGRIVRMASASAGATRSCQTRSRSPSCPSSPPPPRTWTRPRTRTGVSTALPIWLQGPRLGIAERSVLEGTFQTTWSQPPATSRDIFHQPMVLRAPSNLALSTAREGETSLGSLGQCFTTLMVKNFFLLSNVNPPSLSWKPSPLVLSLHALLQLLYKLLSSSERPQGLPAAFSSPGWAAPALPAFGSFPAYLCTMSFDTRAALSSRIKERRKHCSTHVKKLRVWGGRLRPADFPPRSRLCQAPGASPWLARRATLSHAGQTPQRGCGEAGPRAQPGFVDVPQGPGHWLQPRHFDYFKGRTH